MLIQAVTIKEGTFNKFLIVEIDGQEDLLKLLTTNTTSLQLNSNVDAAMNFYWINTHGGEFKLMLCHSFKFNTNFQ